MNTPFRIVADIGGTNARFACVENGSAELQRIANLRCADYADLATTVRAYLATLGASAPPERIGIAVAGAVEQDEIYMPNRGWTFSQAVLAEALQIPLVFINDFTAQVHSIATLQASELTWLDAQRPQGQRVYAVVGPGTGLGVGGMTATGEAIPSEGGHVGFAPQNAHEVQLLQLLWQQHPRVSVETILSGSGLARLYWANSVLQGSEKTTTPAAVTAGARTGDKLCRQAIEDFMDILAAVASDAAMLLGAVDGVYIGGGIVPRLHGLYDLQRFRSRFNAKGDYHDYCSRIPLAIVTADNMGLRGCWRALSLRTPHV
jgi:glucokinase